MWIINIWTFNLFISSTYNLELIQKSAKCDIRTNYTDKRISIQEILYSGPKTDEKEVQLIELF